MVNIVDDSSSTAASRHKKLSQEGRRLNGKHHTRHSPKYIHIDSDIQHHTYAQLAKTDLNNHRKGTLKELVDIGLEYALIVIQKPHTRHRHPNPQNHDFQSPHQELEIQDKIADNKDESEDCCCQSQG